MFGPSPRQTSLLIRFAIIALTLLAMAKFLPRAAGAELSAHDTVPGRTAAPPH